MALRAYERNGLLWGASPDAVLPEGHLARVVNELVEAIEGLGRFNAKVKHTAGEPAYDVKVLSKVLIYAYGRGITSSREMARQCEESLAFRYLTSDQTPDHRTLSRFRRKRRWLLKWLFKQVVRLGLAQGLARLGLVALDSVKMLADAQGSSKRTSEELKEELRQLDAYLEQVEQQDRRDDERYGEAKREDTLPKKLASVKRRREALERAKAQLEADRQRQAEAGKEKRRQDVLPADPQAVWMKKQGRIVPAYSGQVAADGDKGLIVAVAATRSADDREQLVPMTQAVEQTTGEAPKALVADNGYYSDQGVVQVDGEKTQVVVPDGQAAQQFNRTGQVSEMPAYHVDRFTYEAGSDSFLCPQGQRVCFVRDHCRRGQATKLYRGTACAQCPVRTECTQDQSGVRSIEVPVAYEKVKAIHDRIRSAEGLALYRRRKSIIERIFGHWQHNLRVRRLRLRGLAGFDIELHLLAIAHNLGVIGRVRHAMAA